MTRTLFAGLVFLEVNHVKFSVTEAEAANICELLAAGEFDEDALGHGLKPAVRFNAVNNRGSVSCLLFDLVVEEAVLRQQ